MHNCYIQPVFFSVFTTGQRVSTGSKTLSLIEILKMKSQGQVAAKDRELSIREREIALAEKRFDAEQEEKKRLIQAEAKAIANAQLQAQAQTPAQVQYQQFRQMGDWNVN